MSAHPILCICALTYDVILHLPETPSEPGKFMANTLCASAFGIASIATTTVAKTGHPVALWSNAGVDMPRDFFGAEMAREGIATVLIRRVLGMPSAAATNSVDAKGERVLVLYYQPILTRPTDATSTISAVSFSAVMSDLRWPMATGVALGASREHGSPAILDLDVGPVGVLADLAPRANHVVASTAFAGVLTSADTAEAAVRALAKLTTAEVIVVRTGERALG